MAWSIFEEQIKLHLSGIKLSSKYELRIVGNSKMGSVQNISETKIVYEINCEPHKNGLYRLTLYIVEHELIKEMNSAFAEMFELTRKTMQLFRRVIVVVDQNFTIINILNAKDIYNQWMLIKNDKVYFQDVSIKLEEAIGIKDEMLQDENVLKVMISQMEFFDIFQTIGYGNSFPIFFDLKKPNMMRNGYVTYSGKTTLNKEKTTDRELFINGNGEGNTTSKDLKNWYGQFPFFSDTSNKGNFTLEYESLLDKTDMYPINCTLKYREYVQENLQWNIMYILKRL